MSLIIISHLHEKKMKLTKKIYIIMVKHSLFKLKIKSPKLVEYLFVVD